MSELGSAGISIALQGRYEVRDESPVHSLATELFPMVGASDELMDPELHFQAQSRLSWNAFSAAALAANVSHGCLTNPATSGVIGVVQTIGIRNDGVAPQRYTIGYQAPPLTVAATGAAGFTRDSRWGAASRTTLRTEAFTNATTLGNLTIGVVVPATDLLVITWLPLVLGPQSRVIVAPISVNTQCVGFFTWRERKIESGELRNTR